VAVEIDPVLTDMFAHLSADAWDVLGWFAPGLCIFTALVFGLLQVVCLAVERACR
jgi:hypothetical protein